jgi:hypothetical protein
LCWCRRVDGQMVDVSVHAGVASSRARRAGVESVTKAGGQASSRTRRLGATADSSAGRHRRWRGGQRARQGRVRRVGLSECGEPWGWLRSSSSSSLVEGVESFTAGGQRSLRKDGGRGGKARQPLWYGMVRPRRGRALALAHALALAPTLAHVSRPMAATHKQQAAAAAAGESRPPSASRHPGRLRRMFHGSSTPADSRGAASMRLEEDSPLPAAAEACAGLHRSTPAPCPLPPEQQAGEQQEQRSSSSSRQCASLVARCLDDASPSRPPPLPPVRCHRLSITPPASATLPVLRARCRLSHARASVTLRPLLLLLPRVSAVCALQIRKLHAPA